ncbi:MAG: hypothetical protein ACREJ9_17745 [Candidatus Rokuibacteriota bacterium]
MAIRYLYREPAEIGLGPDGITGADLATRSALEYRQPLATLRRRDLIRSPRFWTISAAFALGLFAQVGFLTHQVAYLSPRLGADGAALAVSLTTLAAIVGSGYGRALRRSGGSTARLGL